MYRALVGVAIVCAALLVLVHRWTLPAIARLRAEALRDAVVRVLPGAASSVAYRVGATGRFERVEGAAPEGHLVYAGYDAQGRWVGVAVPASGMGYQDAISLLWGYVPARRSIVGIAVLDSRETPGLGDRIETDAAFLRNFERLDVALSDDGSALEHPIESVPHGQKTHPWQVDAISGATVSSRAVATILRESSASWVPRVATRTEDFSR